MHSPTHNFLEWYKTCCSLDSSVYRNTIYKKSKAKIAYNILFNFDFILYPLDGSESLFYGNKDSCERHIEENFNTKFLIFSKKEDSIKNYIMQNEKSTII